MRTTLLILVVVCGFALASADWCTTRYSCQGTCTRRTCNWWWCSSKSYNCPKVCSKKICCAGWRGASCNQEITPPKATRVPPPRPTRPLRPTWRPRL